VFCCLTGDAGSDQISSSNTVVAEAGDMMSLTENMMEDIEDYTGYEESYSSLGARYDEGDYSDLAMPLVDTGMTSGRYQQPPSRRVAHGRGRPRFYVSIKTYLTLQ